jgi:hypothetical protein
MHQRGQVAIHLSNELAHLAGINVGLLDRKGSKYQALDTVAACRP